MSGALALRAGVVWVARERRAGHVRAYDLDGRPVSGELVVPPLEATRTHITGLAVDADRRLLVADRAAGSVRIYSAFGVEQPQGFAGSGVHVDAHGHLGVPVDVAVDGVESDTRVLIASDGERRHALHVCDRSGAWRDSLRPLGEPMGVFHYLRKVGLRGRLAVALESGKQRVQVFRDGEFHFAFQVPAARGRPQQPVAVEPLLDGRFLVLMRGEHHSSLVLIDRGGTLQRLLSNESEMEAAVDLVVEEAAHERASRIAVLDRDGDRVQVWTLQGTCLGEFVDFT